MEKYVAAPYSSNKILSSSAPSKQCTGHFVQPANTGVSAVCLQSPVLLLFLSTSSGSPCRHASWSSLNLLFSHIVTISMDSDSVLQNTRHLPIGVGSYLSRLKWWSWQLLPITCQQVIRSPMLSSLSPLFSAHSLHCHRLSHFLSTV